MDYRVEMRGQEERYRGDWDTVATFKYKQYAVSFARHVKSYQGEEALIDRVEVRVMVGAEEVEVTD